MTIGIQSLLLMFPQVPQAVLPLPVVARYLFINASFFIVVLGYRANFSKKYYDSALLSKGAHFPPKRFHFSAPNLLLNSEIPRKLSLKRSVLYLLK